MTRAALTTAVAAAALLTVACDRTAEPAPKAEAPTPTPTAPSGKADPMAIWSRGVGALGAQTPFTVEAVQAAFPQATVEQAFLHDEDQSARPITVPIITVQMGGTQALELQGGADGKVSQILVEGGDFKGPRGEVLLQKWSDVGFDRAECGMGALRFRHSVVCKKPSEPVTYVFGVPGWASNEMPPAEVLAAKAQLNAFVWTRP